MQPGSPSSLLTEEFIDLTKEISYLMHDARAASEMLEDRTQTYSLVWFIVSAERIKAQLITTAFCMDPLERTLLFFHNSGVVSGKDEHVTLHDLTARLLAFTTRLSNLEKAYADYLKINKQAFVMFEVAKEQITMMIFNLEKAKE